MRNAKLPGGKINEIPEILEHPQIVARALKQQIKRSDVHPVSFLGFPGALSKTPANHRLAPPKFGEDTALVLRDALGLTNAEIKGLLLTGVIAEGR